MNFKFKRKLPFLFLGLVLLCGYSCQNSEQYTKNLENKEAVCQSNVFSPGELLSMSFNNGSLLDSFKDKSICVSGVVDDITLDKVRVLLKDSGDNHGIVCVLKDTSIANQIQKGNRTLFKGEFIGKLGSYIHLKECTVVR